MPEFHVIELETGLPVCFDDTSAPLVYVTGEAAAIAARVLTNDTGKRHQPRRVVGADWRAREAARMLNGTYLPIPECWNLMTGRYGEYLLLDHGIPDHYLHASTAKDGMVAFTASEADGIADKQTRMLPGRYLQRYFSAHLTSDKIARMAARYAAHFEETVLQFATTADEIEHVYTHGPNSCMAYAAHRYDSSEHPVRAYAGPDLQVAYIESRITGDTRITARAVVWPAKNIYSRIYGDETRLQRLLRDAGYHNGSLRGARLTRIENENEEGGLVVPYVDYESYGSDNGTYIVIGRGHDDVMLDQTNGVSGAEEASWVCENCGGDQTDDDGMYTVRDQHGEYTWCENCRDNNTFYCEYYQRDYSHDVTSHQVTINSGTRGEYTQTWSDDAFETHGVTCEATGLLIPSDDSVTLANGLIWCRAHFNSHGYVCRACGDSRELMTPCDACGGIAQIVGRDENENQIELAI